MMDFATWKNMVIDAVTQISDEKYQRDSWFGKGEHASTPNEFIAQLFDDSMIEEFLESHRSALSDEQESMGREFVKLMNQYIDATPKYLDPATVIDDPPWEEIRRSAQSFVQALSQTA
jgi:hypothetical protein